MPHVLHVLHELNESLQATGGDCRLVARTLREFSLSHRADLAEVTRLEDQLSADERERFELEHSGELRDLDVRVGCVGDADVERARAVAGFRAH